MPLLSVDQLTKRIHVAPTVTTVIAEGVARLFFENVFWYHGLARILVSDGDQRFASLFWKTLTRLLGTKLAMSTANLAATNVQTE